MLQTIIGSGGAIGIPLAKELKKYTSKIRLVSRHPKKVNEDDELFSMDVNNLAQIDQAVAGSAVVYVVIGFEYNINVWKKMWPPFLQAVINACKKHSAKLVFFDNVYMYASTEIPFMTEDAVIQPPSKKGVVRTELHTMIINEIANNSLTALIARAADFYGPGNVNSALKMMVADNLLKGKKAQAFGQLDKIHTYTFTTDAAIATALLGNTLEAYNQVWHLPTTKQMITTQEWIELIAKEVSTEVKIQMVPTWLMHVLGVFIPIMKEFPEMMYQYNQDYIFDSTKFEKQFGMHATPPNIGVKLMMESLRK